MSLKTKISLAVSFLLVLALAVFGSVAIHTIKDNVRDIIVQQQDTLVTRIADDLDQKLSTMHQSLIAVSKVVPKAALTDSDAAQAFLDGNAGTLALFDRSIFIFSPEGKLIAESPFKPNRRGNDFSFREYIKRTVETGQPVISQPFVTTKDDHHTVLMFTAPVYSDKGKMLAIMTGSLGLTNPKVLGNIAQTKIGQTGYLYLTTQNRIMIMHPDTNRIMKTAAPYGANLFYDQAVQGFEGTSETITSTGIETLTSFKRIKATNWILGANYPTNEAFAPISRFAEQWIVTMIGGITLIALIVWRLLNFMTKPLGVLTGKMQEMVDHGRDLEPVSIQARGEIGALATVFNKLINQISKQRQELGASEKRYRLITHNATDVISTHKPDGTYFYASPVSTSILGYEAFDLVSHSIFEFIHPEDAESLRAALHKVAEDEVTISIVYRMRQRNQNYIWIETSLKRIYDSAEPEIICISRDISDRKKLEDELNHLARHDILTNLPNRSLLEDRFKQAVFQANRDDKLIAVLVLDLDRFKIINDTLGHPAGDSVLKTVAERLSECVRKVDTIARPGGDEFVMLLANIREANDAAKVADKIIRAIARPIHLEGNELHLTTSIGISMYTQDGDDYTSLIKNADSALYAAKTQGGGVFQFYTAAMNFHAFERLALENALHNAIERDELILHYQPFISTTTGAVVGVEALVRWNHPQFGLVSPANFIPLAEDTGLICPIGDWVMKTACIQGKLWRDQGIPPMRIAINLSGRQFKQSNLVATIKNIIDETEFDPHYLEVEITESSVMGDPARTVLILKQLKEMGIQISIDDFGTGYSSLAYLKRFPIDTLKVDRSFVQDITFDKDDAAIVDAVIVLSHNLGLRVIAEGVEDAAQANFLRAHKCDEMQGFYFSRPIPADNMTAFLQNRSGSVIPINSLKLAAKKPK